MILTGGEERRQLLLLLLLRYHEVLAAGELLKALRVRFFFGRADCAEGALLGNLLRWCSIFQASGVDGVWMVA